MLPLVMPYNLFQHYMLLVWGTKPVTLCQLFCIQWLIDSSFHSKLIAGRAAHCLFAQSVFFIS